MRLLFLFLSLLTLSAYSQVSKDYAILLSADVQENPPSITIQWPSKSVSSYLVYRKAKNDLSFGSAISTLNASDTSYTDNNVEVGKSYEYYVRGNGSVTSYGYIHCGIKANSEDNGLEVKGKLILLVDSSQASPLTNELDKLIETLESECWTVIRHDVSPNLSASSVKDIIVTDFNEDPPNTKAVFIIGHVAVPYSGELNPDAHGNHIGAWPCDAFYGEISPAWTDQLVNNTSSGNSKNHNIPNDGKFDQSLIPSPLELQVGRVDLNDMPLFGNETDLLRNYINKDLAYRRKDIQTVPRALIDDNFGGFNGEAFAASGWKAFSTFFHTDSIYTSVGSSLDYRTDLNARNYQWSYGCGGGSYTSCGGIGNSSQIAGDSLQSVFTLLFGSYFGDWDNTNNFLRAPLAQGLTLTNAWSGRPHWYFHHMGLGENIGYSQRIAASQNPYYQHYAARFVHIALMGDPTLKLHIIDPPESLNMTESNNKVDLSWTASGENVLGYHIFRKDSPKDIYHRINEDIITTTSFTDTEFDKAGDFWYTVRAVKLEDSYSGSYYNLSSGAFGKITTEYTGIDKISNELGIKVYPNPGKGIFNVDIPEYSGDEMTYQIFAISGEIINTGQFKSGKSILNLSDVESGFYFIRINTGNRQGVEKIVITE